VIEGQELIVSIGGKTITAGTCGVQSMLVSKSVSSSFVTVELSLICFKADFEQLDLGKHYKPNIRNKTVDECTIQELLFAVRTKIQSK